MINPRFKIIANIQNSDNGIGQDHHPLRKVPADMREWMKLTDGATCIMGRVTYEALNPDHLAILLKGRTLIVVTRQENYPLKLGFHLAPSIEFAVDCATKHTKGDIFFMGGAQIYEFAINDSRVGELFLTRMFPEQEKASTSFFPKNFVDFFKYVEEKPSIMAADLDKRPVKIVFETWVRKEGL